MDVSKKVLEDFYQTDSISRASPTMAKCVTAVKQGRRISTQKFNLLPVAGTRTVNFKVKLIEAVTMKQYYNLFY